MKILAHNVVDTLKKHILVDGFHHVIDFKKSHNSWMYDKVSGKKYLDCFGQFASLALGYNHPKLIEHKDRLVDAALCKVVNSDLYSCEYASFVDTLFAKALPSYFKYAFFIEGGGPAVENALKIAFDWKAKMLGYNNPELLDDDQVKEYSNQMNIIHLKDAFHGRTGYSLSTTNTGELKTRFFPQFDWTTVLNPKVNFPFVYEPEDLEGLVQREETSLSQIEFAMQNGLNPVAAVIIEPLQSEGGNSIFRLEYLQAIRKLCDQYDVLLIFDEVQTGLGASGHWWLHEHYCIAPDLMVFGKKMQVCGVVATDKLDLIHDHCFKLSGRINSTWGGNLVDMVRADIIINIIEEDRLLHQVQSIGSYMLEKLEELEERFEVISNARGIGTLLAIDLPTSEDRDKLLQKLREKMLILGCGEQSIRFRPALTFTEEDVDEAIKILEEALND